MTIQSVVGSFILRIESIETLKALKHWNLETLKPWKHWIESWLQLNFGIQCFQCPIQCFQCPIQCFQWFKVSMFQGFNAFNVKYERAFRFSLKVRIHFRISIVSVIFSSLSSTLMQDRSLFQQKHFTQNQTLLNDITFPENWGDPARHITRSTLRADPTTSIARYLERNQSSNNY